MAIIKDAELHAARVQIKEAIKKLEDMTEENPHIYTQGITDHLNEALAHLCNE